MTPRTRIRLHTWLAGTWLVLAIATTAGALWFPEHPVLLAWVIFMSAYANCAAHWSAREGAAPSAADGE